MEKREAIKKGRAVKRIRAMASDRTKVATPNRVSCAFDFVFLSVSVFSAEAVWLDDFGEGCACVSSSVKIEEA